MSGQVLDDALLAGWATVEITPAIGCRMSGYSARTAPANAVHDALYAHALALGTEAAPCILLLTDLIAVDTHMVQEVRKRVREHLPDATLWLGATHTHAGPDVALLHVTQSEPEESLVEQIVERIVRAALEATQQMRLVRLKWVSGQISGVATNRDHPGSGEDTALDLLCFYNAVSQSRASEQWPVAILGSFPCHPTILSAENRALSADLPGAFRRQLGARLGAATWIALATGAAGDISTRYTRREQSFTEVERLGSLLAEQGYQLLTRVQPLHVTLPVVRKTNVALALKERSDSETLASLEQTLQVQREEALQAGRIAQARTLETNLQGIAAVRRSAATLDEREQSAEVAVAIVGELVLVALPGELYNRLGVEIRCGAGRPVLLLGYTNGYLGYVPTRDAYVEMDYEVLVSPFAPGAGERLTHAVLEMLVDELKIESRN